MRRHKRGWAQSLPVYVTRKTADGYIGSYSVSAWLALLAFLLILANVIVWSGVGLYEAGKVVLG